MDLGQGMDQILAVSLHRQPERKPRQGQMWLYIVVLVLSLAIDSSIYAQSGGRQPIPARTPKERAPDIGSVQRNVERDAANLIADVVFKGNDVVPDYHLSRNIGTRAGRYFDPDQLQQDVDKLWRMAEIKKINGPFIDQTDDGLVITFDIVERKHIRSIEFIGNRGLTDRALKKETDLEIKQPLDLHKIRMAKTRIEDLYKSKGFTKTQVEIINIDEVEEGDVKFLIHEDQKQRVWKVDFVGNEFVSDGRLRNFVNAKPGVLKVFGGVAQKAEIDQDIVRLESYYKSFGFFNARIGREVDEGRNGKWLTIRYIIDEGPRYKIRNVSFIGNQVFSTDQLNTMVELKPDSGELPEFNVSKMNQDVVSLRDLYGSEGFVYSSVEAEPRFLEEPGLLDIVYRIEEGKQYHVGKINVHILGDVTITKREVALNRVSLKPGDKIDVREIRNSERRLGSAQIFAGRDAGQGQSPPRIVVQPQALNEIERTAKADPFGSAPPRRSPGSSTRHR